MRQRFPSYTPAQVAAYLKDEADPRGDVSNNTWGHGFAQLPTVVFANLNWNSAQLQNHIARYIVENGYGHPTSLASGSSQSLLQGLRDGDSHVIMEVWLPFRIEAWEEALAAGDVLSLGASLGTDWQSAFVIPAYLQEQYPELDNVEDLKEQQYQALFATAETGGKARLVSCVIGWSCAESQRRPNRGIWPVGPCPHRQSRQRNSPQCRPLRRLRKAGSLARPPVGHQHTRPVAGPSALGGTRVQRRVLAHHQGLRL